MGKLGSVDCVGLVLGMTCACFLVGGGEVFFFPLMGRVCEVIILSAHDLVCVFGLVFVHCLDETSCTGCCWKLGNAGSSMQVVAFVGVLTNTYSLGLGVHWLSRVLEGALPLQRFRAQSLAGELRFHKWFVMALKGIKTNTRKQKTKQETKD